jgi:hypothetical protein
MKIIGANVTGSFILNSQDVTTTIQTSNVWSGSVATDITALNAATASLLNYTASNNAAISDILLETASINTFTSSIDNRTSVIEGKYITTGSNTFVGTQYFSNTTQATTFTSTASLYTDGGLRIGKDAYVSGSAFIKGNLTVFGTSSIEYVTSSVFVGLEYIDLNTDLPALRYAGIRVYDSGSNVGVTGSLFWDSQTNHWVYANPSGSSYSGGMMISGPRASSLGSEQGTTNNALMKGQGGDHITSSAILDDGTSLRIPYLTIVTGTMGATTFSGSGANLTSIPNAALTNSTISGIALGSNLPTLTIGTGLSGTSYNGSGAVTIANTGVTSIVAGTGISINQGTGAVTVTNTITNNNQLTNGAGYITSAGNAATVTNGVYTNASQNNLSGVLNFGSSGATPYNNPTGTSNGISFGGIEASSLRTYGIFTEQENIGGNYSKLTINYHTGIRIGAMTTYGGTRFYNNFAGGAGGGTEIFSVGNGDNHVRVANNLVVNGHVFANAGNNSTTSTGGVSYWETSGPTTTSWVGFKAGGFGGYHGGATATGGYATYNIMDTNSRGWIWRFATAGGTNFAGTNVASIQNDTGQMALGSTWDGTASNPIFAQLNVCIGRGSATNYRDIDMKGTWAAGEGHSITATHGTSSGNIVGQITFQHDSPGSRIRFGKLYAAGDQSTYPMELISNSSGGGGNLYVTGDITAYYSDERLKLKVSGIENALQKVCSLSGFRYVDNELAKQNGYNSDKIQMGLSAQEIQRVAPEIVTLAHFDMEIKDGKEISKSGENYLTINYGKLTPLLIEAIKEQQTQIEELKTIINGLTK